MKPFLLTLLATLCLLAASAEAQTVKAVSFNTTNNTVVSTNRVIFPLLGVAGGTAVTPALTYTFGTNSFGTFASTQVGIGPFLGFSVEGARRLFVSTNTLRVEVAVSFSDTNVAATTRTNLGLYNTNAPAAFAALALWDEVNDEIGLRVADDEIRVTSFLIGTNAPTDTTNAVRWIGVGVLGDTNTYKLPLYQ
jgi:hypothetical protein